VFRTVVWGVLVAMEDRNVIRMNTGMSDVVLGCVMPYIHDSKDRDAASLVCRQWYDLDAQTRKHVTIALCYTTSPDRLRRRFRHLESLKLKGKPRAAMFNLIPEDWGGYVTPWVNEIAESFNCLKSLHFRRMIVSDLDLELLARSRGRVLHALKLDKCSGFSTDGLLHIGRSCRLFFFFMFFLLVIIQVCCFRL
jgi:coronatine-insensitive protein 1